MALCLVCQKTPIGLWRAEITGSAWPLFVTTMGILVVDAGSWMQDGGQAGRCMSVTRVPCA
jgi:hypothetical protein